MYLFPILKQLDSNLVNMPDAFTAIASMSSFYEFAKSELITWK